MNGNLRKAILTVLKFHYPKRLPLSQLAKELGGRFTTDEIADEMSVMDREGLIANDMEPVSRLTFKGLRSREAA